ncbi:LytTR family transcriptional regulator DNA-binding domain-containing protein [Adhaeribacter radiodurans]|uniref:LytTR family transcriptional regulator DNA-binding domain-containing protein n=1 Tax=Adhaeribacter radiodurans TaxID=2745197 RepID=A0A7L7LB51_9BACT|nr:LytTR family transcriptional regulator DNA-binding domain-containing protein [Adhaeribacter radiodurans]QMU30051.1 LytTR family transcriptional regulator DNA-binding domain-containing protein [Adhaeribacter radiodurans]
MNEVETLLNPKAFYRVNRSCICHIKGGQIHSYFNGKLKLDLTLAMDKEVLISRENATDF